MVPRCADQAWGIEASSICLLGAIEIIVLRVDAGEQRADSGQLVAADPPVDDGLRPRLHIEGPAPIALDERDRKRPVVRADIQLCESGTFHVDRVPLVVKGYETIMEFPVGVSVAGIDDAVALRPQDGAQVSVLMVAQSGDECGDGFLRRRKAAL